MAYLNNIKIGTKTYEVQPDWATTDSTTSTLSIGSGYTTTEIQNGVYIPIDKQIKIGSDGTVDTTLSRNKLILGTTEVNQESIILNRFNTTTATKLMHNRLYLGGNLVLSKDSGLILQSNEKVTFSDSTTSFTTNSLTIGDVKMGTGSLTIGSSIVDKTSISIGSVSLTSSNLKIGSISLSETSIAISGGPTLSTNGLSLGTTSLSTQCLNIYNGPSIGTNSVELGGNCSFSIGTLVSTSSAGASTKIISLGTSTSAIQAILHLNGVRWSYNKSTHTVTLSDSNEPTYRLTLPLEKSTSTTSVAASGTASGT